MKKLGKKISFLTKIMLVLGLIVSNLSSLSTVFAYEVPNKLDISVVEDGFEINYLGELAEDLGTLKVVVYEHYTYLDGKSYCEDYICEKLGRTTTYSLTVEELLEGLSINNTILDGMDDAVLENIEVFDGLYELRVEVTDALGNKVGENVYSKNIEHEKGLDIKVYDSNLGSDVLVSSVSGKYSVTHNAKIVAKILAGGLSPADKFQYKDGEIHAYDLLKEEFVYEVDFTKHLFGEYNLPINIILSEELSYNEDVTLLYGEYLDNTNGLNDAAVGVGLDSGYIFSGAGKAGVLYTLLDLEKTDNVRTMLDLYNIVNPILENNDVVSYVLSNSEYEDVLESYNMLNADKTLVEEDETLVVTTGTEAEEDELTLEEFLGQIVLDDTASVSLTSKGVTGDTDELTITYDVLIVGDLTNDQVIDEKDIVELINQVVSEKVKDLEKLDFINEDGEIDITDVMYLNQVVQTKNWYIDLTKSEQTKLNAKLEVLDEDITSGDTFDVQYILSLSDYDVNGLSGALEFDESLFELVNITTEEEWIGSNKDGKFIYITDEKLIAPEVIEEEFEDDIVEEPTDTMVVNLEVSEETEEILTNDYVIVTATFKALKSTAEEDNSVITLENIELFDENTYIELDNREITTNVIEVSASDNNKFATLNIAGQDILLEENVYEYKITVSNDVTAADIVYTLENVTASVTSIVSPEELVEGDNEITLTVVSESGVEQVYTVIVTREAAEEEKNVEYVDNYYGDYDKEEEEVIVTPAPEETEKTEEKEENGTLSRVIIIILILFVIAGLIYLIFKDEDDDETKRANKEINKLKGEDKEIKTLKKEDKEVEEKTSVKKTNNNNKKGSKNNKKER